LFHLNSPFPSLPFSKTLKRKKKIVANLETQVERHRKTTTKYNPGMNANGKVENFIIVRMSEVILATAKSFSFNISREKCAT
jgi:hypothetical protein